MTNRLKETECFLFDMDGTIYLGEKLLPGTQDFLGNLDEKRVPYYCLTNNSSRSRSDYVEKLNCLGLQVPDEKIITSGEATAIYLKKQHTAARVYLVGTPSLESEFIGYGFHLVQDSPDYIVLGFDTTLTYQKLWKLCDFVRAGIPYIATHSDINCPTETGYMPDIGAVIAFVETATGRRPDVIVGKPHPPMIAAVVEKTGCRVDRLTMVGDRLYTDIAMGIHGMTTVLVLSGETKEIDLENSEYKPDFVVRDIRHLVELYNAT